MSALVELPRRQRAVRTARFAASALVVVLVAGILMGDMAEATNLTMVRQPPSFRHPFGTDRLGRDMLARTLVGIRLSLGIAALAAALSGTIALGLGAAAGAGRRILDTTVSWLIDLFLALPHLILLILVALAAGRGVVGVLIAVGLTHWPSLTRVLRAEAHRVANSDYVAAARHLGRGSFQIGIGHVARHLIPQALVGSVLMFPHAVLHESALSFLGLGLDPHEPAIGIILADSLTELSAGAWWLALLPGLALLTVVLSTDALGRHLEAITDPRRHHE